MVPSAEYDLGYLEAAINLLEKYLLSKEIYWKMRAISPPGESAFQSLTLGGLLLARARSRSRPLSPSQKQRLTGLESEIDRYHVKWRTAWENKALEEFRLRLNLLRDFLEEYRMRPEENVDRYAYEIGRRVMLHLLRGEIREVPPAEQAMLAGLDAIITNSLLSGEFIWAEELSAGFPQDEYPYLYGILRGKSP